MNIIMTEKEVDVILETLVKFESDFICDEMYGTDYCENNCKYSCPQKDCYKVYVRYIIEKLENISDDSNKDDTEKD